MIIVFVITQKSKDSFVYDLKEGLDEESGNFIYISLYISLYIFLFTFDVTVALNNEELEKIKFKEQLVQDERKNTILIRYKDAAHRIRAKITAISGVEEQANVLSNIELLQITEGMDVEQLINELSKHESIETVELNHVFHTMENMTISQGNLQDESKGIYETAIAGKASEEGNMVFGRVRTAELPGCQVLLMLKCYLCRQHFMTAPCIHPIWFGL